MPEVKKQRILELSRQIVEEQDPSTFLALVEKLNDLLDEYLSPPDVTVIVRMKRQQPVI